MGQRNEAENPTNREERVGDNNAITRHAPVSLASLNNDCLACIFSFLPVDYLNDTILVVNKRFCRIRSYDSIDQARTATIVCSRERRSSCESLCLSLDRSSIVLRSHYTHLKIVGLGMLEERPFHLHTSIAGSLPQVTTLEFASNDGNQNKQEKNAVISCWKSLGILLPRYFPNVKEIRLTGVKLINMTDSFLSAAFLFGHHLRGGLELLSRIRARNAHVSISGYEFAGFRHCALKQLDVDNCCFVCTKHDNVLAVAPTQFKAVVKRRFSLEHGDGLGVNVSILSRCWQLQRLSIKGARWTVLSPILLEETPSEPVSQAMLVKMVRHLPHLRWLRSDLTAKNIERLQTERPEITFVTD